MACLLTKGRSLPCKTGVGGLKSVYFTDYGGLGTITTASNEITAISGTPTVYQFDIKGNSTLETTVNSSRENGTTFYESTLTLNFTFLEKETQAEIYFLVGKDHGAELTSGTFSSGAAMGDLSGYSLTFVAQETEAPDFTQASVVTGANQGTKITPN
jgi:hypothetical protein